MMGFDPLRDLKYVRLAHELGLGCGDPRDIEIVGDQQAAQENWHFDGPFKKMTFAANMQHKIYWGKLKNAVEWSLKTWLAPWAYIASVLYHDLYWYPRNADRQVPDVLNSDWARLFHNWEKVEPDENGWKDVGTETPTGVVKGTGRHLWQGTKVLGTCIREAPEFAARKRHKRGEHAE